MSFYSEFKEFAVRGNVVDMAVGVVIGGAFGKIVTSFVNDIVCRPLLDTSTAGCNSGTGSSLTALATEGAGRAGGGG